MGKKKKARKRRLKLIKEILEWIAVISGIIGTWYTILKG